MHILKITGDDDTISSSIYSFTSLYIHRMKTRWVQRETVSYRAKILWCEVVASRVWRGDTSKRTDIVCFCDGKIYWFNASIEMLLNLLRPWINNIRNKYELFFVSSDQYPHEYLSICACENTLEKDHHINLQGEPPVRKCMSCWC